MNGVTGTALEINPFSKVTTTPFFAHQQGYNTSMDTPMPWGIYPGNIAYSIDNALQWERLNASFVGTGAILAARDSHYQHDQGTDGVRFKNVAGGGVAPNHDELWSSIFNGNKFGFFPSGSIVKFTIPGAGNPGKTNTDYGFLRNASFWIVKVQQAYNARFANDVTDTVTMSFPVKGTRNVTSMANGGFTYTSSGTTKAEFDAATPADHKYWHDKPNNALYVKFDGKSHASYYMFSFTTT
jgi:hypothetical protein